jgi:hypothetical protein
MTIRHLLLVVAAVLVGCSSTPEVDARSLPSATALEVIAVLRRHVPDDTYRFEPARDFTGRNVFRSSLLRLENLERAHSEALRAGHMDGVIAFAKARSLERIRAFDLAASEYAFASEREETLRAEALRSADLCLGLHEANAVEIELVAEGEDGDGRGLLKVASPDDAILRFEKRTALIEALARSAEGTHHLPVVREEIERNDVLRARYFVHVRELLEDGDVRAVAELQRVALRHPDSKNAARHLLSLADLYAELSGEYVEVHPPEGLTFDPAEFRDLVDSGARIYEMVAARDGTPEKLEASRRLEAFLAFSLAVDRDRFTP